MAGSLLGNGLPEAERSRRVAVPSGAGEAIALYGVRSGTASAGEGFEFAS